MAYGVTNSGVRINMTTHCENKLLLLVNINKTKKKLYVLSFGSHFRWVVQRHVSHHFVTVAILD